MVRTAFHIVAISLVVLVGMIAPARGDVSGTESITSVYSLEGEVAGYDPVAGTLRFFRPAGNTLREGKPLSVEGQVMGVVNVPDGYAYVTGMGRNNLSAPIQVRKVAKDGSRRELVFERTGERNQVTQLIWSDGKLWIDFYESKYFTSIGYLSPASSGPWIYTQVASTRMGDSIDIAGNSVAVGRSYGDDQGHDGDLLLFQNGERTRLPSYRGARGVKFLSDSPTAPSIIIGDGWHQNYGQVAQARVSLLRKRSGEARYALEILDHDTNNTDFSKFFEVIIGGKRYVAARGSASVNVYGPEGEWRKKEIYTQSAKDKVMDVAFVGVDANKAMFAVLDNGLRLVSFAP